jgi:hypothetical protein
MVRLDPVGVALDVVLGRRHSSSKTRGYVGARSVMTSVGTTPVLVFA